MKFVGCRGGKVVAVNNLVSVLCLSMMVMLFAGSVFAQNSLARPNNSDTITPLSRWDYGGTYALAASGDTMLYGDGNVVRSFDITDMENPLPLGEIVLPRLIGDIAIRDNFAYVLLDTHGLSVIDLNDITDLQQVGYLSTSWEGREMVFKGDSGYVVAGSGGLRVLDVADMGNPVEVDSILLGSAMQDIFIVDSLALVAAGDKGLRIIRINGPLAELAAYDDSMTVQDVVAIGSQAIIATSVGIKAVSLANLVELELRDVGSSSELFQQLSVRDDILAAQGTVDGLLIYQVQDDTLFTHVAAFPIDEASRGVVLQKDRIFLANDVNGVRLYDLDVAMGEIQEMGLLANGSIIIEAIPSGDRLYLRDVSGSIQIIDISDLQELQRLVRFKVAGEPLAFDVTDSLIFVATADSGVHIYDATQPDTVHELASLLTGMAVSDVAVDSIWLYVSIPDSGITVFDISNPAMPLQIADGGEPGIQLLTVYDGHAHGVTGESWIIYDVGDRSQLPEISRVDTTYTIDQMDADDDVCYQMISINGDYFMQVWDISDIANPQVKFTKNVRGVSPPLAVDEQYVYYHEQGRGLSVFDYGNPSNPVDLVSYRDGSGRRDIAIQGNLIFSMGYYNGFDVYFHDRVTGLPSVEDILPQKIFLDQNYPNPFNGVTQIEYVLQQPEKVRLVIVDVLGRQVKTLTNEQHHAGRYQVTWDGTNDAGQSVASGVYLYQLTAGDVTLAKKLILVQ